MSIIEALRLPFFIKTFRRRANISSSEIQTRYSSIIFSARRNAWARAAIARVGIAQSDRLIRRRLQKQEEGPVTLVLGGGSTGV